jgi:enediyne biosynthesis protein E4
MKTSFQLFSAGMFLATVGTGLGQPIITNQPQNQTVAVSNTATLTVGATGTQPLAYQWQQAFDLANYVDRPEGTNSTLVITNVQYADSGNYRVIVTNADGAITSDVATLSVQWPPTNAIVIPTNSLVSLGVNVTLQVMVSGNTPFGYQWCLNCAPLSGRTNKVLTLTNVQLADAGSYTAIVTNSVGAVTSAVATLHVDPLTFTKITTGPVVTDSGEWAAPSWWDHDNDGFLELYVANSGGRDALYHYNGNGIFSPVTNAINPQPRDCLAGVVGDYNNDGLEDLLTIHWGSVENLYRNDGNGNFIGLTASQLGFYSADIPGDAGWADYDLDGFVDLFVANYNTSYLNDNLYHNKGDGTFTRMTAGQVGPLVADNAPTSPCAWVDYDNDGYPDLWVGTGFGAPTPGKQFLWHNNRNGKFSQVSAGSLTNNLATACGLWGDYDNDGYPDLFLTDFAGTSSLHHNVVGQTFTDVSRTAGVSDWTDAWGAAWGDYDNDGYLDLFVAAWEAENQSILYHNNGNGTFTTIDVGSPLHDFAGNLREFLAWADYDNDGFLDLLIICWTENGSAKNLLYHNNGNSNAWLKVKLVGKASNRSAIGAKVCLQATIRGQTLTQMREINGNSGMSGGACGLLAHFGLGDATNVDLVRIEWPSGIVQQLTNVTACQFLTVTEHQAEATTPPGLAASKADGKVQLSVTGQTNLLYVFEASTNLVQWTKIAVRTNLTGTLAFTPPASSGPRKFYRVLMP